MKKDYKLIIFDLDGTLIDTHIDIANAVNYALKTLNLKTRSHEAVRSCIGKGIHNLLSQILSVEEQTHLDHLLSHLRPYYRDHIADYSKPFEGVIELLVSMKKQEKKLAVATNKPSYFTLPLLERLKLTPYFSVIHSGDTVTQKKPHPEMAESIISLLDVAKENVLFVGDSETDYKTAINAEIDIALFTNGFEYPEVLARLSPTFFFDDYHSLINSL